MKTTTITTKKEVRGTNYAYNKTHGWEMKIIMLIIIISKGRGFGLDWIYIY
jgi:hypothetical protein